MTREDDKRREEETRIRERANRDADANTSEPTGGLEGPARPGTTETGRPDRDQLGAGDRMDLDEVLHQRTRPQESREDLPSEMESHREDRKELTQQRAQSEDRSGNFETDTQGSQSTRSSVGLQEEAERGGRHPSVETDTTGAAGREGTDIERPRPRKGRDVERDT